MISSQNLGFALLTITVGGALSTQAAPTLPAHKALLAIGSAPVAHDLTTATMVTTRRIHKLQLNPST